MLSLNRSRSDDEFDAFSSNINALAESMDCGRRLLICEPLFCRWVIIVDDVGVDVLNIFDAVAVCYISPNVNNQPIQKKRNIPKKDIKWINAKHTKIRYIGWGICCEKKTQLKCWSTYGLLWNVGCLAIIFDRSLLSRWLFQICACARLCHCIAAARIVVVIVIGVTHSRIIHFCLIINAIHCVHETKQTWKPNYQ